MLNDTVTIYVGGGITAESNPELEFIETALRGQIGTSWDPSIRFANSQQFDLWFKNINNFII